MYVKFAKERQSGYMSAAVATVTEHLEDKLCIEFYQPTFSLSVRAPMLRGNDVCYFTL